MDRLHFTRIPELPSAGDFSQWFGEVDTRQRKVFKIKAPELSELLGRDSIELASRYSPDEETCPELDDAYVENAVMSEIYGGLSSVHATPAGKGSMWHFDEGDSLLHLQGEVQGQLGFRPVFFTLTNENMYEEPTHQFPPFEYLVDGVVYYGYTSIGEALCFYCERMNQAGNVELLAHSFCGYGSYAMLDAGIT